MSMMLHHQGHASAFAALLLMSAVHARGIKVVLDRPGLAHRHQVIAERDKCEVGSWSCAGNTLKRCVNNGIANDIIVIQECPALTVCSAIAGGHIGCGWAETDSTPITLPEAVQPANVNLPNGGQSLIVPAVADQTLDSIASPPIPTGSTETLSGEDVSEAGTPPTVIYTAPHYVLYADSAFKPDERGFPKAKQLKGVNRFLMGFWVPSLGGAFDIAKVWRQLSPAERGDILTSYHAADIALMLSYGGQTETPTTNGEDPIQLAKNIAAYVKKYALDGVDVNYEDLKAMDAGTGEAWVILFQKTLRQLLPKPYLISHAPIAPWFKSPAHKGGGYLEIEKQVGKDSIDWYNIQYYNQGAANYMDCASIFHKAPLEFPKTSVFEIMAGGVIPREKIVVGKPMSTLRTTTGFMEFKELGKCVKKANAEGWNGGIMIWEWDPDPANIQGNARAFADAKGED